MGRRDWDDFGGRPEPELLNNVSPELIERLLEDGDAC